MNRYMLKELSLKKLEYGSGAAACKYDGSTRYVRITDIDNEGNLGDDIVSPNTVEEKYVLHDGDILFARTGATVGKTYLYRINDGRCIYAGFLIRLVPDTNIIRPEYLYYYTKSPTYKRFVQNSMKVVAQPNINAKQYGELELNVPTLKVQDEIVLKLGLVNSINILRKRELQKLDQLIKARFVELFGDPKTNDKKWKTGVVSKFYEVKGGKRIPKGMGYANGITDHPYLRVADMKNETILDEDIHYIDESVFEKIKRYTVKGGDIYLTNVGVNLGMAGVIPDKYDGANLTENAVKLVPKSEKVLNGLFLAHYINSPGIQDYINERKMSVGVPKLAIFRIETMPIILPPMELQNIFNDFCKQVDKSKVAVKKSLDENQKLFDSLMQQYFE